MSRLKYIDWLRGVAVLAMIEWHALESWTRLGPDRDGPAWRVVGTIGGLAAPLFLFLAGVALPLALAAARRAGLRSARGGVAAAEAGLADLRARAPVPAAGLFTQSQRELVGAAHARHSQHPRPWYCRLRVLLRPRRDPAPRARVAAGAGAGHRVDHAVRPALVVADAAAPAARSLPAAGRQLRRVQLCFRGWRSSLPEPWPAGPAGHELRPNC